MEVQFKGSWTMRRPFLAGLAIAACAGLLAGCQSADTGGALSLGRKSEPVVDNRPTELELRAGCPKVTLREGTAYFDAFEKGGQGDRERITYQTAITDVTRNCQSGGGSVNVTVAVAGRIVPGPKGKGGQVTLPIRVAALLDGQVIYSQLHKYPVEASATEATQFIFSDPAVSIPAGSENRVQIFAGFDEGPPAKKKAE